MPAITITENGFVLDGPLVAGEPAAVSVSGLSLAAGAALSLTCTARFPDALLASVALTQGDGGAWGGVLDTATKRAALYFLTARADEARAVVLELVDTANRDSLARVSAPMLNSSLLPKPDKAEGASPLMIPGPPGPQGPQGPKGDPQTPSDATPLMDGTGAAGTATTYARGDHRHPSDTSKQDTISDLATIRSGAAAGATAYQKPSSGIPASDLASGVIPTVPVTSVNTKTGAVVLSASDIGDGQGGTVLGGLQHLDSTKQDTISDLAAIRSGAAAGATAVQPSAMPASETWTFVVDDGQGGTTTVTKQVAVYAAQQGAGA